MKVLSYPKWKKNCVCETCSTKLLITYKDVVKKNIHVIKHYNTRKAIFNCPFCDEKVEVNVQDFYKTKKEIKENKKWVID